jgi:hypothetical protein
MDASADRRRNADIEASRSAGQAESARIAVQKKYLKGEYDVFLCHNGQDKDEELPVSVWQRRKGARSI